MYDFIFTVRDLRWPADPAFKVGLIAADAREAWQKFESSFPFSRYMYIGMEHNMFNTSRFSR